MQGMFQVSQFRVHITEALSGPESVRRIFSEGVVGLRDSLTSPKYSCNEAQRIANRLIDIDVPRLGETYLAVNMHRG